VDIGAPYKEKKAALGELRATAIFGELSDGRQTPPPTVFKNQDKAKAKMFYSESFGPPSNTRKIIKASGIPHAASVSVVEVDESGIIVIDESPAESH